MKLQLKGTRWGREFSVTQKRTCVSPQVLVAPVLHQESIMDDNQVQYSLTLHAAYPIKRNAYPGLILHNRWNKIQLIIQWMSHLWLQRSYFPFKLPVPTHEWMHKSQRSGNHPTAPSIDHSLLPPNYYQHPKKERALQHQAVWLLVSLSLFLNWSHTGWTGH